MAEENRNTENFVLGLIVAAIVYFFFLRHSGGLGATNGRNKGTSANGGGTTHSGSPCACNDTCAGLATALPDNPGVSVGNQSYNSGIDAFGSSSVVARVAGRSGSYATFA